MLGVVISKPSKSRSTLQFAFFSLDVVKERGFVASCIEYAPITLDILDDRRGLQGRVDDQPPRRLITDCGEAPVHDLTDKHIADVANFNGIATGKAFSPLEIDESLFALLNSMPWIVFLGVIRKRK